MSEEIPQQKNSTFEEKQNTEEGEGDVERSAKRSRSDAFEENAEGEDRIPSPKRTRSHEVVFRIIVPSKHIGRVIGKEGSRIQKIREETKASIKIADAVARYEERVIIISSNDDNEISDAEKALLHIASLILKEDDDGVEQPKLGVQHLATNMMRLLIAGSQAGCLIGKSGQNIENIRNLSGATVSILDRNQLPICASAHESDRLVQISGNVSEVLKALKIIGCQLRENPARKVIARPTYGYDSNGASQTSLPQTSADFVTSELMIAEALVGGLIGKCGFNISRIRNESGATIKVSGGRGEQNVRQIFFQGSAHQVAVARKLVDDYIYSQSFQ